MRKKLLITVAFYLTLATSTALAAVSKVQVRSHIKQLYSQFHFNRNNRMSIEAFTAGVTGYYNLKEEGKISKDVLTICDFTLSANRKRMWILDMRNKRILLHTYVAHGQGSGEEYVRRFSNTHNSHTSSQGFYSTGDIYTGNNGRSIKLHGLDGRYNSNAYSRAIVLHGAYYVSESFIRQHGRLGRSYGCPAVEQRLTNKVINYIHGRSAFFIYSKANGYLQRSHWITSPIGRIPGFNAAPTAKEKEETEAKTIKKFVPKTQQDSMRMGLIAPNTEISDGKYFVNRVKLSDEEAQQKIKDARRKEALEQELNRRKIN